MHKAIAHHPMTDTQPIPKQWSLLPVQLPQLIYCAWCHMVWNIPLVSLCQLSWLCPLPASHAPLCFLTGGASMRSWKFF